VVAVTLTKPGVDFSDVASWPRIGGMTWSGYQKKKFFRNLDRHSFMEMAGPAGVDNDKDGRGIGVGDFDNDGRLDFYQTNADQPSLFYRNVSTGTGHWIELKLIGTRSNRDAIGARVTLQTGAATMIREVNGGNGYAGESTQRLHIGLGAEITNPSLQIHWPSGLVERVTLPIDRVSTVREGEARGSK